MPFAFAMPADAVAALQEQTTMINAVKEVVNISDESIQSPVGEPEMVTKYEQMNMAIRLARKMFVTDMMNSVASKLNEIGAAMSAASPATVVAPNSMMPAQISSKQMMMEMMDAYVIEMTAVLIPLIEETDDMQTTTGTADARIHDVFARMSAEEQQDTKARVREICAIYADNLVQMASRWV